MSRLFGCCSTIRKTCPSFEYDDRYGNCPSSEYDDRYGSCASSEYDGRYGTWPSSEYDYKYGNCSSFECDDRISDLPDLIMHQMLSFLPAKEAAKTCTLSKRWHHIWETFPILECDQLFFGKYLDLVNPKEVGLPKDFRRKIFRQRAKFMSFVDERLQRVHENDVCLKKFCLVMTLVSLEYVPRVDSWIDVVIGSVQELELRLINGKERFYALPLKVLDSSLLTILRLKGCTLTHCSGRDDIKLNSLVELHLQDCFIDEDSIQRLISSIESMEVLSLKRCLGFTKLKVHGHNKLKKLAYHPHRDLKVEGFSSRKLSNLQDLEFLCVGKAKSRCKLISCSDCPNVKRLLLAGYPTGAKSLQSMISSFRQLERLVLSGVAVEKEVSISVSAVKEVHLHNCSKMVKAELDTPALRVLRFYGNNLPHILLNNVAASRIAEIPVLLNDMDNSWFMKLNVFIKENKFQDLIVYITAGMGDQIPFITNDLRTQVSEHVELKSLRLVMQGFTSVKYAALLAGLFWCLHPKTLRLELNYSSPDNMKGLLECLVVDAKNPDYCCSKSFGCWRHSLKDIKLGNMKGFQAGTPLNLFTLSSLNSFVDNWSIKAKRVIASNGTVEGENLAFDLSW